MTHWMIFVRWSTVADWKRSQRDLLAGGAGRGGELPYQYGSDQPAFRRLQPGDVLWIVTTPRFDGAAGRARPPSVMARLRVKEVCCHMREKQQRIRHKKGPKKGTDSCRTVRLCGELKDCQCEVSPASARWALLVCGEPDREGETEPLRVTYPPLYNAFSTMRLVHPEAHERVQGGKAFRSSGGPYAHFGQKLFLLRKLSREAGDALGRLHRCAVENRRVFFSYRWADLQELARRAGLERQEWIRRLNWELEARHLAPWLDHHQLAPEGPNNAMLHEILSDAVHQATIFVALVTPGYGEEKSWSEQEWSFALDQVRDGETRRSHPMRCLALEVGGDLERLGVEASQGVTPEDPSPKGLAAAIAAFAALHP